jgi:hypothetical protein
MQIYWWQLSSCIVTPCGCGQCCWCFGGKCCLFLQSQSVHGGRVSVDIQVCVWKNHMGKSRGLVPCLGQYRQWTGAPAAYSLFVHSVVLRCGDAFPCTTSLAHYPYWPSWVTNSHYFPPMVYQNINLYTFSNQQLGMRVCTKLVMIMEL